MASSHSSLTALFVEAWQRLRQRMAPLSLGALLFAIAGFFVQWGLNILLPPSPPATAQTDPLFLGLVAILYLVMLCVWLLTYTYYLVIAIDEEGRTLERLMRACALAPQMLLLALLVFLQSYAWIAFIGACFMAAGATYVPLGLIVFVAGLVMMIIRLPRCILAPVLVVRGSAAGSAMRESSAKTDGHWGTIVGCVIVLIVVILVAIVAFGAVVFALLSLPGLLNTPYAAAIMFLGSALFVALLLYVWQLSQAYAVAFVVGLGDSLP